MAYSLLLDDVYITEWSLDAQIMGFNGLLVLTINPEILNRQKWLGVSHLRKGTVRHTFVSNPMFLVDQYVRLFNF